MYHERSFAFIDKIGKYLFGMLTMKTLQHLASYTNMLKQQNNEI